MIVFPTCKINLGLSVIGKRMDGYHDLETVFYPVDLTDVLEMVRTTDKDGSFLNEQEYIDFSSTGLPIAGDQKENLCLKAWQLLKNDFPILSPIDMHLHKVIPMGAGLGGGSSDGAFTLKLLNDVFQCHLTSAQLIDYAAQLGSDCPFFIINKPCYAWSRGEMMEELPVDLSPYSLVLVYPGIHINTRLAFMKLNPEQVAGIAKTNRPISEVILQPVSTWKEELFNDFEQPVFDLHPQIKEIKDALYRHGAHYASMTGSGSTVFGIFEKGLMPPQIFRREYTVVVV